MKEKNIAQENPFFVKIQDGFQWLPGNSPGTRPDPLATQVIETTLLKTEKFTTCDVEPEIYYLWQSPTLSFMK